MSGAQGGVLVVGSVNADLVVTVARRPGAGETVLGSDLATFPGGKGANQAVAPAPLGAPVALVGRARTDSFGPFLREGLGPASAGTPHPLSAPRPTGVTLITLHPAAHHPSVR